MHSVRDGARERRVRSEHDGELSEESLARLEGTLGEHAPTLVWRQADAEEASCATRDLGIAVLGVDDQSNGWSRRAVSIRQALGASEA